MNDAEFHAATWSTVFGEREYRGLWAAYAASLAGDQLARVAIAVIVFDRTDSAGLTAAAYAISLVPWLVGGPFLSGLGDRYPRRTVMIACDVGSAVLIAVMTLPNLRLPVLCGLLFMVVLLAAPFSSARSALMRDVFPDERYAAATAINSVTGQAAQVVGYGLGGVLVAALGPRQALELDAATFSASAFIVRLTVRKRPATRTRSAHRPMADIRDGCRLVFGNRRLRTLALYAWLAAFHVAPAGVVVPYAARHGGGPRAVGLLLAASAVGTATAMIGMTRWASQAQRIRLMNPLATLAAAPLALCALDPSLPVTLVLWCVAGVGSAYQLGANVAFVSAVPNERRAQAFGLVSTGLIAGQGTAILAAGVLADLIAPHLVVALSGALGTALALVLGRCRTGPARSPASKS